MSQPFSLFDRIISKKRSVWITLGISSLLLLLPFVFAYLDGMLGDFFQQGYWRVSLLAPTIIIYIWLISPVMARVGEDVISALRPIVLVDNESFEHLVNEASRIDPKHEWVAFSIGVILGVVSALASGFETDISWLSLYWFLSTGFMYGLLIWTIYIAVVSTRLNTAIHRQPLRIDILDTTPFEAIGRQSLLIALVFIGGITLSLIFAFQVENMASLEFWLSYLVLILVTVLIFFMSMRPTHRVLVEAKKRELEQVQRHLNQACRDLVQHLDEKQEPGDLAPEINALVAYEQRLQAARTWPYNTTMLRTLFFSVFIPLGTVLGRLVAEIFFR